MLTKPIDEYNHSADLDFQFYGNSFSHGFSSSKYRFSSVYLQRQSKE
jgi:hypothetical protein